MIKTKAATLAVLLFTSLIPCPALAVDFPGPPPGQAQATLDGGKLVMANNAIEAAVNLRGEHLGLAEVTDRLAGTTHALNLPDAFTIELADGTRLPASQLKTVGEPVLEQVSPNPQAVRLAERDGGWKAAARFAALDGRLQICWEILLHDGSNYLRQRLVLNAVDKPVFLRKVTMIDAELASAAVQGDGVGSPVATGNLFAACEYPMAGNRVEAGRVVCEVPRHRPLEPGQSWAVAVVVGVVPEGQLRRGFLYYLERERARPYGPLFYYISWFDIAYDDRKMNEALCLKVIDQFGLETAVKRGVKPDMFIFDDGWDDNRTLWRFHEGFPKGFKPLETAAAKYDAVLGTWISPWGGYGRAKKARLEYGEVQGFETAHDGFSLAGPTYFGRFRDVCLEHIEQYGVRYFKFDGIGKGSSAAGPGEEFGPDIEAMLDLIAELREHRPDLFFNTTVGTWPSPYWLFYSDSIWRGGGDLSYHGSGSRRQQWITYRDGTAYRVRVCKAPLYPLNSIKSQGVMYAQLGLAAELSTDLDDLVDDIHMAAASGSQLQEFFVTPSMMPAEGWDAVAESITWLRENADVLVDTHWIGGDPNQGQIYGYASWSPRKGILVLRNPSDKGGEIGIDLKFSLDLPETAATRYRVVPRWQRSFRSEFTVIADKSFAVQLRPYEMIVLEVFPEKEKSQ